MGTYADTTRIHTAATDLPPSDPKSNASVGLPNISAKAVSHTGDPKLVKGKGHQVVDAKPVSTTTASAAKGGD